MEKIPFAASAILLLSFIAPTNEIVQKERGEAEKFLKDAKEGVEKIVSSPNEAQLQRGKCLYNGFVTGK